MCCGLLDVGLGLGNVKLADLELNGIAARAVSRGGQLHVLLENHLGLLLLLFALLLLLPSAAFKLCHLLCKEKKIVIK